MNLFTQLICPVSPERIDENRVRVTALGVILIMGVFFMTGNVLFPAMLIVDFYIRAFTRLTYSPLSWLAHKFVMVIGTKPVLIDKAPKVFAARIGLLFAISITVASFSGFVLLANILGATLALFAFLECGLNFCTGCWVYTFLVYPRFRKMQ